MAGDEAVVSVVEGERETGRIEAFSDGVFAIATTLLVLEIKVPQDVHNASELWGALLHQWPSYVAYLMGFSTIAIMWMNHHMLFRYIRRTSHWLLVLNSLLLLTISFLPFPTAMVAEYIKDTENGMAGVAMMVYSGTSVLIALFYNFLWWHMSHNNRLINKTADPAEVKALTRSYAFGPVVYMVALLLAIVSAQASLVLILLLALFFLLPGKVQGSLAVSATGRRR
ncbi:MAG: TMEM175 family protein [Chloroflexota bacterium]